MNEQSNKPSYESIMPFVMSIVIARNARPNKGPASGVAVTFSARIFSALRDNQGKAIAYGAGASASEALAEALRQVPFMGEPLAK